MDAEKIKLRPRFIVDSSGKPQSAVLSMREFRELTELLEDYIDLAELEQAIAQETSFRPFEEVLADLERDGHQ